MKKLLGALAVSVLITALLPPGAAQAAGADDEIEGKYRRIKPGRPLEESNKVEVVDVFWYGCPHCYRFLPFLQRWEKTKPDYVAMKRMPAIFAESWIPHARAFYTAFLLGVDEDLHTALFNAIHGAGRTLNTREELSAFFSEHGVSAADFESTYDSFTVDQLERQSQVMARRWAVQGTPSVIVNGRYLVSGSTAGSFEEVLKVLDVLVAKEHEAMAERTQ